MIKLFSTPEDIIDLSSLDHILHGSIVTQFEERFAEYVGAKYACSTNSATSAIFLVLKILPDKLSGTIHIPSIIPPVVLNAILMSGHNICFIDNIDWVGHSYFLHTYKNGQRIIDSAQRVDRGQFKEASDNDLMIFSFYPTKPVGSCDGGMVVSNNKDFVEEIRTASMNGMKFKANSWERIPLFPGYKMYMNSVQAKIAMKNLIMLDDRKAILAEIRAYYNKEFGLNNTSDHLYRINVDNNDKFIEYMKNKGIICGKHYEATHLMPLYSKLAKENENPQKFNLPMSEKIGKTTVSIPFHYGMTMKDAKDVVGAVQNYV